SAQVLKEMDADIAETLTAALEKRGITIFRNTRLSHVRNDGARKRVHFEHAGQTRTVEAAQIIFALGRTPAIEGLALDRAGVKTAHGIDAAPTQQCGAPHLFAAGD